MHRILAPDGSTNRASLTDISPGCMYYKGATLTHIIRDCIAHVPHSQTVTWESTANMAHSQTINLHCTANMVD